MILIHSLVGFIGWILNLYTWIIIAAALITWVSPDPYNPIARFLSQVTEPVLRPIRRLIPTYKTGIDLSPLIAIILIQFIERVILPSLLF